MRVKRLQRGAEDGFHSGLVIGLKSSEDAERLVDEIAFAHTRLTALREQPFGLWAEVAGPGELEERTWLAFLIAYIGPAADGAPFSGVEQARIPVAELLAGGQPDFTGVERGERGAFEPARAATTIAAYRAWIERSGTQQAGITGESVWTPERRFERDLERLTALAGIERDMCFEMLGGLGATGTYPITVSKLALGGENEVSWAAKRAFGIGDPMLLERRAAALAQNLGVELAVLELALHNWGTGVRAGLGFDPEAELDSALSEHLREQLGL